MKPQNGFTLVELAIVLMIIGLLIGGVLRGQELMSNAQVTGTIQQVKAYQGATVTFNDQYNALPGDMAHATNRVPGCTTANNCGNGNGNGRIGNVANYTGGGPAGFNTMLTAALTIENTYYWKHLSMAHLISGIIASAPTTSPTFGITHPTAKIGGGFIIYYSNNGGDAGIGHILRLQTSTTTDTSVRGKMPLSPIKARQIDQKMDDGMPDRGSVSADYSGTNCDNGGVYQNTEEKNCVMQFNIH